jgi:repressor LexA
MLEQLTERQRKVYLFIRDLIQNRGYGPTVREIGERKGLIRRSKREARAIELLGDVADENREGLPLAGRVAAGVMHEAIEQDKRIDFTSLFQRPGCFVLEISGDSMIEAQIADGDFAVVDPHRKAAAGDIVVARTDPSSRCPSARCGGGCCPAYVLICE